MTKISKNKNKVEGIRKRVGIFRSVQTILKRDQEKNSYSHSQIHVASHVRHQVQKSLADQLRSWALECHLKHSVLSKLLTILKLCGFNSLPKDREKGWWPSLVQRHRERNTQHFHENNTPFID